MSCFKEPEPPPGDWVFITEQEVPLGELEMPKAEAAGASTFIMYLIGSALLVLGTTLGFGRKTKE